MSSRPKKGHNTGDRGQRAKKDDSVPRASGSTAAQKPPKQTKDDIASEAQAIPLTSQLTKNEREIHEKAASHFQNMSLADRIPKVKLVTQPNTRELSPIDPELTSGIGFIAGPGKWSFPNSAPNPGRYLTGLYREDFPHTEMADQAHHMKASYDAAIILQPSLGEAVKSRTVTGYYQIQKERQKTKQEYEKRIDRYGRMVEENVAAQVPSIEYSGVIGKSLEMRLGAEDIRTTQGGFEKGLETAIIRQKHLASSLMPTDNRVPGIMDDVKQDLDFCSQLTNEYEDDDLIQHPEFLNFMAAGLGNLIVHGADLKYKVEPTSRLSSFFWKVFEDLSQENVVLAHSIGLSTSGRSQYNEHLKGSSGLLRSLCSQMLACGVLIKDLSLIWLTNKRLQDAAAKKHARTSLALLFRDLILDVAEHAAEQKVQKNIRVIVDGIDRIEKVDNLMDDIAVFRGIADEVEFGPLKEYFSFKYVLLHPQVSSLAVEPHSIERHIFLPRNTELQASKEKVSTGRKKGKGKGKRAADERGQRGVDSDDDDEDLDNDGDENELRRRQLEQAVNLRDAEVIVNPILKSKTKALEQKHLDALKDQANYKARIERERAEGKVSKVGYRLVGDGSPGEPVGQNVVHFAAVWTPQAKSSSDDGELSSSEVCRQKLSSAIYGADLHTLIAREKHYDRQSIQQRLKQDANNEITQLALEHPELILFPKPSSAGLILHGQDTDWDKGTKPPLTPFAGLLSAPLTSNPNVVRLTYAAGLDLLNDPRTKTKILGTSGCMRQLCIQLIQHPILKDQGFKSSFMSKMRNLEKIKEGTMASLLSMFRMLLLEVAHVVNNNASFKTQNIEVVIDGANWLDHEPEFGGMVNYFRMFNDEVRMTEIRKHIRFRYLIIHSDVFRGVAANTHVHERHLFWEVDGTGLAMSENYKKFRAETEKRAPAPRSRRDHIDHFYDVIRFATNTEQPPESDMVDWLAARDRKLKLLEEDVNAGRFPDLNLPAYSSGIKPKTWSSNRQPLNLPQVKELDTAGKRRHQLEIALNAGLKGASRAALAKEDRRVCGKQYFDRHIQQLIRLFLMHPDMMAFRRGEVHGFVVHDDLVPGQKIPIPGERSERALAAFTNLFHIEEARRGTIVLTHVMGTYAARRGVDERRDGAGIIRSLCCQLIDSAFRKYRSAMELEHVDGSTLDKVQDCQLDVLCRLFRDLLCDLAAYLFRTRKPKQKVLAIIDCTQIVGSEDIGINVVADMLRTIIDEIEVCELGEHIDLNYILLRPAMEHLIIYPTDRHLFFEEVVLELEDDDDEVPDSGPSVPSRKGKGSR